MLLRIRKLTAKQERWAKNIRRKYSMKQTVKRWCSDFGFGWYGPGIYGAEKYDYKIHFDDGSSAMFRTANGKLKKPTEYTTNSGKTFLVFPVFSQFVGQKEMSRSKFVEATKWVKKCLSGNITEFGV